MHILSAVGAIGPFFILIPLLGKMKSADDTVLQLHLDTFRSAVRLSKHTGHVLVTTGVLLVWIGGYSWKAPWIVATLIILVSSLYFIARAFSPTIRELRQTGNVPETRAPLLRRLARALYLYLILLFIMMWFMVAKPTFG